MKTSGAVGPDNVLLPAKRGVSHKGEGERLVLEAIHDCL